jgi:TetR/AcrR family transcriptional regulator, cholesterol catabolism regulator
MPMTEPPTRKDQIYEAAERLFSERGYYATTMREIARELQIEGGSLYSHISSKQDLLYEIVLRGSEQFLQAACAAYGMAEPARVRLHELMRRHLAIMAASTPRAIVHFHEWRHLDEERQAVVLTQRDKYESYVREIIREGVAAGEFAPYDERLLGVQILSLLNWTYQWYKPGGTWNADELAKRFFELLMRGMEPR